MKDDPAVSGRGIESSNPDTYEAAVSKLLAEEKFEELDRIATAARSSKSRFPGGSWKLFSIYRALCGETCGKSEPTVVANIQHLKNWVTANPKSITARVALADAYNHYAWLARGDGYSDTVEADAWKLFAERMQLARGTLDEAARASEPDPQWYVVMLRVMRAQQSDLSEMSAILEKSSSLEPLYYYQYQEFAFTLQPRWYGEEGDSEKFAEAISEKIGGEEGAVVYFNLATSLNCVGCAESKAAFDRMSWPKIQEGYAALERRYGLSKGRLNAFAHLAIRAEDHTVALGLFLRIGQNWDKSVWHSRRSFDSVRAWALSPSPEFARILQSAGEQPRTPDGIQYSQQIQADFTKKNAPAVEQCTQLIKDDTQEFLVALNLDKNGDATDVQVWPPTKLSTCVVPRLARHAFAPPPTPSLWVILSFMETTNIPHPPGAHVPESGD